MDVIPYSTFFFFTALCYGAIFALLTLSLSEKFPVLGTLSLNEKFPVVGTLSLSEKFSLLGTLRLKQSLYWGL